MPIEIYELNDGKQLEIHVSEKLLADDYKRFVPEFERLIEKHGKLDVLFEMEDFHGWSAGALWEDTKFALHHFNDIERLAIVGEKKWQKDLASFSKPFTKATVRYFDHTEAFKARKWFDEAFSQTV